MYVDNLVSSHFCSYCCYLLMSGIWHSSSKKTVWDNPNPNRNAAGMILGGRKPIPKELGSWILPYASNYLCNAVATWSSLLKSFSQLEAFAEKCGSEDSRACFISLCLYSFRTNLYHHDRHHLQFDSRLIKIIWYSFEVGSSLLGPLFTNPFLKFRMPRAVSVTFPQPLLYKKGLWIDNKHQAKLS